MDFRKEEGKVFSIESVAFIFRRPWLIIIPFIILLDLTFTYTSLIKPIYKSTAVLSFEEKLAETAEQVRLRRGAARQIALMEKVLVGENIRAIIEEAWPEINEETDRGGYEFIRETLRHTRSGIQMHYNKRDPRLVYVSFMHVTPYISYKVVRATVDTILRENKKAATKDIDASISFLNKQLDFYKDKLKKIDIKISLIKSELIRKASELNKEERTLISEILDEDELRLRREPAIIEKTVTYSEITAELNLHLIEAEKRRELFKKRLERGDFIAETASPAITFEDDEYIKNYTKAIDERELTMTQLVIQGYTLEHPQIKRLQSGIDTLKAMKEKRIEELKKKETPKLTEREKKTAEKRLKNELEDLEFQIEVLKDKISLMEKRVTKEQFKKPVITTGALAEQASRLAELRNEKEINTGYYIDIRKRLEELKLKSRLDEAGVGLIIRVLEKPIVPPKPVPFQKLPRLFMGLMMSLGAGIFLAYFVDMTDNSVRTAGELRNLLQIPILVSVDKICTPEEIRAERLKRKAIIAGLASFTLLCIAFVIVFRLLTK